MHYADVAMEAVQKDILDHVERSLRSELITSLANSAHRDSHEVKNDNIKGLMYTFDDLAKFHSGGIQLLLRQEYKCKNPFNR